MNGCGIQCQNGWCGLYILNVKAIPSRRLTFFGKIVSDPQKLHRLFFDAKEKGRPGRPSSGAS
jgi:hypothetical protein